MKNVKKILAVLLLVVMVFSFAACSSGPKSIVGVWEMEMEDYYEMFSGAMGMLGGDDYGFGYLMDYAFSQSEATMEFTNDGRAIMRTYFMGSMNSEDTYSYEIEGDKLIMDGSAVRYTLNGNKLILMENGLKLEMTRK